MVEERKKKNPTRLVTFQLSSHKMHVQNSNISTMYNICPTFKKTPKYHWDHFWTMDRFHNLTTIKTYMLFCQLWTSAIQKLQRIIVFKWETTIWKMLLKVGLLKTSKMACLFSKWEKYLVKGGPMKKVFPKFWKFPRKTSTLQSNFFWNRIKVACVVEIK